MPIADLPRSLEANDCDERTEPARAPEAGPALSSEVSAPSNTRRRFRVSMATRRRIRNARPVRRRSPARRSRAPPPAVSVPSGPGPAHTHIVCRRCARISHLALTLEDLASLTSLVERRPRGWSVDGISYSLTGVCPRCAAGSI